MSSVTRSRRRLSGSIRPTSHCSPSAVSRAWNGCRKSRCRNWSSRSPARWSMWLLRSVCSSREVRRLSLIHRQSKAAALAQMKDVSRRFPVASAMVREFRTLAANATLDEAVDALLATSQHDFPVVDETGSVAGLLTRHDLIAALRKNDPGLRVGDVMRRDIPTVTTGTRFEDAFRIMQECNCPAVPVLDRMKRLVGLL